MTFVELDDAVTECPTCGDVVAVALSSLLTVIADEHGYCPAFPVLPFCPEQETR